MSALTDLIARKREAIAQRFAEQLYQTSAASSLPREHVIDSLRDFLDELATALRRAEEPWPEWDTGTYMSPAAGSHGKQRFELGYDVGALIREYGIVQDVLFRLIEQAGLSISLCEMQILSKFMVGAITASATRYAHEREEEMRRQSSKHIAFLAHELRTPLGSMHLAFERLRSTVLTEDNRSSVVMSRSLRKLSNLIDDALVEIKLRDGVQAQLQELSIPNLVRDLVEESTAEAAEKRIHIRTELAADRVCADYKLLHSALSNLLRNAVKFTHDDGVITLRARSADHRVVFEVEDQCGGLPEGTVHKLFDPYVQVGRDRSGFGLGLAIAKQAVDAHDGDLRVHNLPAHGCVFLLELPDVQAVACGRPSQRRPT
jgi:signal transduction histidine kinase